MVAFLFFIFFLIESCRCGHQGTNETDLGDDVFPTSTMFQVLAQDKVTAEAAVKHSIKAAQHQTVTATHDLAATVVLILVAAEAMADHIMAPAGLESL